MIDTAVSGTAIEPIINCGEVPDILISLTVPELVTAAVSALPLASVDLTASV